VQDAREASAEWAELVRPLAVGAASGAYTKARRLRAAELSGRSDVGPVRRTPEAVARAEEELAAAERAAHWREQLEKLWKAVTLRAARGLLDVREELRRDEDADYWLDEITAVVKNCRTPRRFASLAVYLSAAVRHLRQLERRTGQPAAATPAAGEALAVVGA
jgi:hypothetical protein